MITYLDGILDEKQPGRVTVDVGGVGYAVSVPLSSFDRLPPQGERARVLVYHHITEGAQALFGFATEEEREMFTRLIAVSGIGPKSALSALSGLSARELKRALLDGDVKRLSSISGIGRKTAERIVVELRDKFSSGEALEAVAGEEVDSGDTRLRDAAAALISLGYKQEDARKMIRRLLGSLTPETGVEEIVRKALTG